MAARTALRKSANSAPNFARWTTTLFVFLAFAFQSYVTQTHIHFAHEAAVNIFASADKNTASTQTSGKQNPDKYPPNDDPANCPICQEVMHSGAYVMPDFVALLLPSQPISIVPVSIALPAIIETVTHNSGPRTTLHLICIHRARRARTGNRRCAVISHELRPQHSRERARTFRSGVSHVALFLTHSQHACAGKSGVRTSRRSIDAGAIRSFGG